mmetsp:Transcript_15137/g.22161  ORF Transcript_15137/g.22161 Transcript_15137/m.22161 type:complete len:131 (-) Transcript_15137:433-825(-)|eukprot:CAMPEP_0197233258 /NCGR_PEP_ID=MMETSP1429-20130617/1372_1 /TAXON_ID=49237 /ORGANISM="Chaetoceros  sp., Strain UNC1202" /LENGTH=130 /DNA_ID=CAMNT_0042691473 /DNA_START=72 /DNA_END=464 /DNA_ORIENTATION=-
MLSEIIDWHEAMEQCGNDEEFLFELLDDFREELTTQLAKIQLAMAMVPVRPLLIRSAAHVIKGAAANLFCEPLRQASFDLEKAAKEVSEESPHTELIVTRFEALVEAANNYYAMVDDIKETEEKSIDEND